MSHYGRPRRRPPSAAGPTPFFVNRRERAPRAGGPTPGAVTLERVAHPESLIAAYDRLQAFGGMAPGRDGVTYAHLGRAEVCAALRGLSEVIRAGQYRPAGSRTVSIPKAGGRRRTLTLRGVLDRVVSAALNHALTPVWGPTFLDGSHGFRPGRGVWTLLAGLEAAIARSGRTVLAQDDVRDAFPSVVISDLMGDHRERFTDPGLLTLVEAVVRGGDDPDRTLGVAQGDPYSPACLNARLHATHDAPLARGGEHPPWFRYADNLAYLTAGVPEGHDLLGRVGELLAPAGFALKGVDGPPVDLRDAEAQLLGFRVTWGDGRLRLRPGGGAWGELARHLGEAHDDVDPTGAARGAVSGWLASYGPAFATTTESETLDRLHAAAASQGFREPASPDDLRARMRAAHRRWQDLRGGPGPRAGGRGAGPDDVWRSAPTIAPGVPF